MGVTLIPANPDHILLGRSAIADKTIERRTPQLIKIPVPLPPIPVLTPLLSPVVGGSNSNNNPDPSTPTAHAVAPQTSPLSGSGSSSGGIDGGSSISDTSSSAGGSDSSSSSTGATSVSGGDADGGSSSSSAGAGDSSRSGATPGSGTSSADGGAESSTTPNTDTPDPKDAMTIGGSDKSTTSTAGTGGIPSSGTGTSVSGSDAPGHSISGTVVPSSQATPGSGAEGSPGGSGSDGQRWIGAKHRLSSAAIAGITLALIVLLLAGSFFAHRRRLRARRHKKSNMWLSRFHRPPMTYGDQHLDGGRLASTLAYDTECHSRPRRSSDFIPAFPPMAEVGQRFSMLSTSSIGGQSCQSDNTDTQRNAPSMISVGSTQYFGSSEDWKYLYRDITSPDIEVDISTPSLSFSDPSSSSQFPNLDSTSISAYSRPSSVSSQSRLSVCAALPLKTHGSFQSSANSPISGSTSLSMPMAHFYTDPFAP